MNRRDSTIAGSTISFAAKINQGSQRKTGDKLISVKDTARPPARPPARHECFNPRYSFQPIHGERTINQRPPAGHWLIVPLGDGVSTPIFALLHVSRHFKRMVDSPPILPLLNHISRCWRQLDAIVVDDHENSVAIQFTPTIPHCRFDLKRD